MELDELLDREGLDPDELMTWAQARAESLLAELSGESDELVRLLEPAAKIDIDTISVRRVAVVDDMLPVSVGPYVEDEVEESITQPISIPIVRGEPSEPDAAEIGTRGRRRVPSTPQPLSASELPPPPDHPRLADGEPEPMLETVDTGPIDLGTFEARAMIAAHSTRVPLEPEPEPEPEPAAPVRQEITQVAPAPTAPPEAEAADASEEFEIDELEELDDEELELLEEEEAGEEEDDSDAAPTPPPRPPSKPGAPRAPATVAASETASESTDSFDIDLD